MRVVHRKSASTEPPPAIAQVTRVWCQLTAEMSIPGGKLHVFHRVHKIALSIETARVTGGFNARALVKYVGSTRCR